MCHILHSGAGNTRGSNSDSWKLPPYLQVSTDSLFCSLSVHLSLFLSLSLSLSHTHTHTRTHTHTPKAVTAAAIRAVALLGPLQLLACFLQRRQRPGSSQTPPQPQHPGLSTCPALWCPARITLPVEPFWPRGRIYPRRPYPGVPQPVTQS